MKDNTNMPSITKIQELIETAWSHGFDVEGKNQLGGKLKHTAKWIGATDVCALLSWLKIKYSKLMILEEYIQLS